MKKYGPLNLISSLRFEAKHKELKNFAKATTSRINPAYKIALRHQLKLCHRFISDDGFSNRFQHDKISKFSEISITLI